MRDDNIIDYSQIGKFKDELTAILREGARRLLQVAVETELGEFLKQHKTAAPDRTSGWWCAVAIIWSARSRPGSARSRCGFRRFVPATASR